MSKFRTNIFLIQTMYLELLLVVSSFENSDFQSQFYMSKIIRIFLFFFIEALYFLEMCPIFVGLELVLSSSHQKNVCIEFTYLHSCTFNVLVDHCDPPQPWTL